MFYGLQKRLGVVWHMSICVGIPEERWECFMGFRSASVSSGRLDRGNLHLAPDDKWRFAYFVLYHGSV
jgi:hypothetical protein